MTAPEGLMEKFDPLLKTQMSNWFVYWSIDF